MSQKYIQFGKPLIGENEKFNVTDVLSGSQFVHGEYARSFENNFSKRIGVKNSITTSSCTAALHLALHANKININNEVIVPAMSHVATAHCVEYQGAKPVFVDIDKKTGNIDLDQLEIALSNNNIKAINLVHFLGIPCDVNKIKKICKGKDIIIIEDCALALDASLDNIKVGTLGDVGCFSFYPTKHITTGEGGMLTTNNQIIANKVRKMKAFGYDNSLGERKIPGIYDVLDLGYNYRMSEFHAAIGLAQLKKLGKFLKIREENYDYLHKELKDIEEIYIPNENNKRFKSSRYCLNIILSEKICSIRNTMIQNLKNRNIGVSVHYPKAIPHFKYYKDKYSFSENDFPVAKWYAEGTISLPIGPHLNLDDMVSIKDAVKDLIYKLKK